MHSRLSGHKGWRDRVGAALLTAAGMFGAEGCATTNAAPRDEAYKTVAQTRSEDTHSNHELHVSEAERVAERVLRYVADRGNRISLEERRMLTQELSQAVRGIGREPHRPNGNNILERPLSLSGVNQLTASRMIDAQLRINARALADSPDNAIIEPVSVGQQEISPRIATHIARAIASGQLITSFSQDEVYTVYNGTIPREVHFRSSLSSSPDISPEQMNAVSVSTTADFVRAYAHALQTQEDQAMARAYAERQRAQRQPIDTQDLPSGINFDAAPRAPLRAAPSPAPLMDDPYGDTNQPTHHRHRRHHRGH